MSKSKGAISFASKLNKLPKEAKKELQKAAFKMANEVRNKMVEKVQKGPATGKAYKRGESRTHIASSPGEAPATDFGFLASNIAVKRATDGMSVDIGVFGSILVKPTEERKKVSPPTNYAVYLEFGTKHMEARPFLQPSAEEMRGEIIKSMSAALKKAAVIAMGGK